MFFGIFFNSEEMEQCCVTLQIILLFCAVAVYRLAESSKLYEEGMTISATDVMRENLRWVMPDGEHMDLQSKIKASCYIPFV